MPARCAGPAVRHRRAAAPATRALGRLGRGAQGSPCGARPAARCSGTRLLQSVRCSLWRDFGVCIAPRWRAHSFHPRLTFKGAVLSVPCGFYSSENHQGVAAGCHHFTRGVCARARAAIRRSTLRCGASGWRSSGVSPARCCGYISAVAARAARPRRTCGPLLRWLAWRRRGWCSRHARRAALTCTDTTRVLAWAPPRTRASSLRGLCLTIVSLWCSPVWALLALLRGWLVWLLVCSIERRLSAWFITRASSQRTSSSIRSTTARTRPPRTRC